MILGLGTDLVDIKRFQHWSLYCHMQLKRVFTSAEIDYCLLVPAKSRERFAGRFAAKEALFKALSPFVRTQQQCLVRFLPCAEFITTPKGIEVILDWTCLRDQYDINSDVHIVCSITHTTHVAFATVILYAKIS